MWTVLWAMVPGPIRRFMAWAVAGLLVFLGIWTAAKREARQEAATEALKGTLKNETKRKEIDQSVDQETDLVSRAHKSGLVRPND